VGKSIGQGSPSGTKEEQDALWQWVRDNLSRVVWDSETATFTTQE